MASPLTVWSSTADGYVRSTNADYPTARSGGTMYANTSASVIVGQYPTYVSAESFVSFDTSSVGAGSTVTVATVSLNTSSDSSDADFTFEARIFDWGASVTTADWRSGNPADANSLDEYTLVASASTVDWPLQGYYKDLTSEAAFLSNVSKTATTYLVLDSSRHLNGDVPSGYEYIQSYSADDATGGGGTDRDPKLYVEWAASDRTCLIQFGIC